MFGSARTPLGADSAFVLVFGIVQFATRVTVKLVIVWASGVALFGTPSVPEMVTTCGVPRLN